MQRCRYQFLRNGWVHSAVAFAVSVDEAFVAVVVVFDPSSAWAFEHHLYFVLSCLKLACVYVLGLDLEALGLDFLDECFEVFSMVFMLGVAS